MSSCHFLFQISVSFFTVCFVLRLEKYFFLHSYKVTAVDRFWWMVGVVKGQSNAARAGSQLKISSFSSLPYCFSVVCGIAGPMHPYNPAQGQCVGCAYFVLKISITSPRRMAWRWEEVETGIGRWWHDWAFSCQAPHRPLTSLNSRHSHPSRSGPLFF